MMAMHQDEMVGYGHTGVVNQEHENNHGTLASWTSASGCHIFLLDPSIMAIKWQHPASEYHASLLTSRNAFHHAS